MGVILWRVDVVFHLKGLIVIGVPVIVIFVDDSMNSFAEVVMKFIGARLRKSAFQGDEYRVTIILMVLSAEPGGDHGQGSRPLQLEPRLDNILLCR